MLNINPNEADQECANINKMQPIILNSSVQQTQLTYDRQITMQQHV